MLIVRGPCMMHTETHTCFFTTPRDCAGAKEFKAKYEEAMDVNEKLLASDEAAAAAEAKVDETDALADKVKDTVTVADKE